MRTLLVLSIAAPALVLSACATNNSMRGAAGGAAAGGLAGAVIGNNVGSGDATTGAAIGALVGGAAGAYAGCREDGGCRWNSNNPNHSERHYDSRAGRYYYVDRRTGETYWENGEYRGRY
jgi:phage tail tape-measure protein